MIKRKFLKGFNEFWFERSDGGHSSSGVWPEFHFPQNCSIILLIEATPSLFKYNCTSVYFWCKVDIGNVYKVDLMGCCMFDARSWHCDIPCCDIVTFHVMTLWHFVLWHCDIWHCDISRIPINILLVWVQSTCTLYLIHINAICAIYAVRTFSLNSM